MSYCEFCGEKAGALHCKCNYCGGNFCGKHRLPENHDCGFDVEYRKKRIKEKKRNKEQYRRNRDIGVRGEKSFIGSLVLYLVLIIFSITSYFYPYQMCLSYYTIGFISDSFIWTIFTSIFVIYFSNPFELAYFIILLVCSYYYMRTIENKYGPKLLLFIFVSCSVLGGLFNLFFFFFIFLFLPYFSFALFIFPIGLASGGLLGLNLLFLLAKSNKDWYFFRFKLKGKQLILFLVIINIVVNVITSIQIFADINFYLIRFLFVWCIFDLIGMLGTVFFYKSYFKKKYYI